MLLEQKTTSATSIDTTGIAICIANILHDYLKQQSIKVEYINNDRA
ncbi:hypothetical protein HCR15_03390 [Wolbachia pipientis]|nr:hypothetical protein [Wolbachia pipientis]MBA8756140.1 hypothetical protein [Wolbachia pipientis]